MTYGKMYERLFKQLSTEQHRSWLADLERALLSERDELRAQLADVTRERDAFADERRLVALELGCGLQVPLPGRLADVAKHYVSQVRDGEARLTRERDEARAAVELVREECARDIARVQDEARVDAAQLREALEALVEYERKRYPPRMGGDEYPSSLRGPMAAAHAALVSAPSAEPTRAQAERWLSDGPEEPGGTLAFHAEPTPRDMRVAEAVRVQLLELWTEGLLLGEIRALDLAAVVAKAVKP